MTYFTKLTTISPKCLILKWNNQVHGYLAVLKLTEYDHNTKAKYAKKNVYTCSDKIVHTLAFNKNNKIVLRSFVHYACVKTFFLLVINDEI